MLRFYKAWTYFHLFCYNSTKVFASPKQFWFRRNKTFKKLTIVALLRSGRWFASFYFYKRFGFSEAILVSEKRNLKKTHNGCASPKRALVCIIFYFYYKRFGFSEAILVSEKRNLCSHRNHTHSAKTFRRNETFVPTHPVLELPKENETKCPNCWLNQ